MRKTRLNVSWLGTPYFSSRTERRRPSLICANSAMSQQFVAPPTVASRAINKISVKSCSAFGPRGSSNSEKHAAKPFIGISLRITSRHLQNQLCFPQQQLIQYEHAIPLRASGGPRSPS